MQKIANLGPTLFCVVSLMLKIRRRATVELSVNAKEFIRRHIHAVWQLELLLLFKNSAGAMSVVEASRNLYMDPKSIEKCIHSYVSSGILIQTNSEQFNYSPVASLIDAIEDTARTYSYRKTSVINFIYSSPI